MKIDITLETRIHKSYRVDAVAGLFDVALQQKSRLDLSCHLPASDGNWRIGAIVGPSGSGKSTVAARAYGSRFLASFPWPQDQAVVDAFHPDLKMDAITGALNAVGFSSPPAWVLPYAALSTGQRMRCDLARALLTVDPADHPLVAFDEFTSVVDRQVGQYASAAVAKAVRNRRVPVERFVAVTCHYDVLDWLQPDWVLDMADRRLTFSPDSPLTAEELARGALPAADPSSEATPIIRQSPWQRPTITLQVQRGSRSSWALFGRHHYLSTDLHQAASVYLATWQDKPVAFCATLANAGHKGKRMIHRLVVLPDYQGLGIGLRLLDAIAAIESAAGYIISIRTSHPALIASLRRGGHGRRWYAHSFSRFGDAQRGGLTNRKTPLKGSTGRPVATFRYRPLA